MWHVAEACQPKAWDAMSCNNLHVAMLHILVHVQVQQQQTTDWYICLCMLHIGDNGCALGCKHAERSAHSRNSKMKSLQMLQTHMHNMTP